MFVSWIAMKWAAKNIVFFMINGFFIMCLIYGWSIGHSTPLLLASKMFALGAGFYFLVRNLRMLGLWAIKNMLVIRKIKFEDKSYYTQWRIYKDAELKKFGMEEKNV